MEIKTVWSVYFSATGTTEKVVTTLAKTVAQELGAQYQTFSFNLPKSREDELTFGPGRPGGHGRARLCRPRAQPAAALCVDKVKGPGRPGHPGGALRQPQL